VAPTGKLSGPIVPVTIRMERVYEEWAPRQTDGCKISIRMTRRAPLIWVNAGSQKKKRGEHFASRAVVALPLVRERACLNNRIKPIGGGAPPSDGGRKLLRAPNSRPKIQL
jgi:hypothetical protein